MTPPGAPAERQSEGPDDGVNPRPVSRRVLITGAASGLGWAMAQQFHRADWQVLLLDRDGEKLRERQRSLGDRCELLVADLLDPDQTSAALAQSISLPLDLLINNAGITHRSQASVTEPAVFAKVMSINWFAPVWLTQQCMPALERARGGVICISSMAGRMPVPGRAAYGASKAALALHFEAWRPELWQRGIQLLVVYPSFLATSIEQNALGSDGRPTLRPRSTVGAVQSADAMAAAICAAHARGRKRLFTPQRSSRLGAWMWARCPGLYERIAWKKFATELE